MISKITGQLMSVGEASLSLEVESFEYHVRIPEFVRRQLQGSTGRQISLHTVQYLEGNAMQGRLVPRMVGFSSEAEREFFELFCSVDGVGVTKALRAMVRPVQDVARMIEDQDVKGLTALPGIGPATAERIVAKLRRKVPKFALLVTRDQAHEAEVPRDVVSDTFEALRKLGHPESDARKLVDAALATGSKFDDVEGLMHAVYKASHRSSA